jgi:AbrB family looped-hinge helix DNA binding protein
MSLADACLVRLSEVHAAAEVLTLDGDFRIYRRHGNKVIPVRMTDWNSALPHAAMAARGAGRFLCGRGHEFAVSWQQAKMVWADGWTHSIMAMNTRLVIDKAGRVVIPKPLREELQLEPGDTLEMESTGEQITLRPVRGTGPLTKEHCVWVFHSGQPLPASATEDMLDLLREERDLANLGKRGWEVS